jgi:hypothetical protein
MSAVWIKVVPGVFDLTPDSVSRLRGLRQPIPIYGAQRNSIKTKTGRAGWPREQHMQRWFEIRNSATQNETEILIFDEVARMV